MNKLKKDFLDNIKFAFNNERDIKLIKGLLELIEMSYKDGYLDGLNKRKPKYSMKRIKN